MDGQKFKVLKVEKDSILVDGIIDNSEIEGKKYKTFWCQAKDDVSPQDIFRLQTGSPQDRALIAKYCLQDCALCNKLMGKLQILINNVGMANVCHVPLSYLFLRGQGVKIFSLVAKKCREEEHLIKVNKKKKKPEDEKDPIAKATEYIERTTNKKFFNIDEEDDDEDDELGYEGATVFEPKTGAHYEPVPVLDYASLYPNSMILRNLSHETYVDDDAYDNLEAYRYHTIEYKNSDGTTKVCRFAENLDGSKGIIPKILMELLAARKKCRKEAEETTDPLLKSILDGRQLAYKVTANSVYGQTGAPTSPIKQKHIAASTTATGREYLQFSKYFVEHIYYDALSLIYTDKKDEYLGYMKNYMSSIHTKLQQMTEQTYMFTPTHISKFQITDLSEVKLAIL